MIKTIQLIGPFLLLAVFSYGFATDYCVDKVEGKDSNSGLCSSSQPWSSIDRVSLGPTGAGSQYRPGDTIRFRGGQNFRGSLTFSPKNTTGTNELRTTHPMIITSCGSGRATLQPKDDDRDGFDATDVAGFEISNLNFNSASYEDASKPGGTGRYVSNGIYFTNDRKDGVKLRHVNIDHVSVNGFALDGILFVSRYYNTHSGFDSVRITNSEVAGNGDSGIAVCGDDPLLHLKPQQAPYPYVYSFTNFYIGKVVAHDNPGIPAMKADYYNLPGYPYICGGQGGNGIILTTTQYATVEHSAAYHNGRNNGYPPGSWESGGGQPWMIGIGPNFNSDHIVVQFNEVYDNYDPKTGKGDWGLDFDGGVSNSIFQYNYSHGNAGGMFVCGDMTKPFNEVGGNCALPYPDTAHNVVRYNIFENDGKVGSYGELQVRGGGVDIYNNVLYADNPAVGPMLVIEGEVSSAMGDHLHIYDNILYGQNGMPLISTGQGGAPSPPYMYPTSDDGRTRHDFVLAGNAYYDGGCGYKIIWGGKTYTSVRDWSQASGQERLGGAFVAHVGDPKLCSPGNGGTIFPNPLQTLAAYRPKTNSPLIHTGLDLHKLFGIDVGKLDFFRHPLPPARDVGADESQPYETCHQ